MRDRFEERNPTLRKNRLAQAETQSDVRAMSMDEERAGEGDDGEQWV